MVLAFESLMLCDPLVTHLLQLTFWSFPKCFTICGLSIQICASMGSILIQNNATNYLGTSRGPLGKQYTVFWLVKSPPCALAAFSGSRSVTVSLFPSRCSRKHPQRFPALSLMIILGRYEKRLLRSISFPQKLFGGSCIHTGPRFGSLNPCWMSHDHHTRSEQVRSWDCVSGKEQITSRPHNSHGETDSQNYQWSAVCDNGSLTPVAACQPCHAMWNLAQRHGRSASVNPGP